MRPAVADALDRAAHAILKRLVQVDAGARDEEAMRACGDDARLLAKVRGLLDALGHTSEFLEAPIGQAIRDAARGPERPVLPSVPGFEVARLLGIGGMAAVYEATQEWPRRRVALKVLRRSVAGPGALRRFEFETEVLARLRHPGIAQIYEAGTFDDGAGLIPFFAMEFIENARPITEHCDALRLDHRARLALMAQVCDAVQHGHLNGVIHRDLKPANVLVDATGAPRVIDFGIARPMTEAGRGQATTMGQIIGTLNAMSPEQCTSGAEVDARTDVYSLGMLLYELLCGRPPHELDSVPLPEALRMIHQVDPRRPSVVDPRLRGDIEAIILKAMEKEPERRYRTAAALGTDLRRFLEMQTVEARAPTVLYQIRLFARRNRGLVAAVIVVAGALVAATAISVVSAIRAGEELEQRIRAEATARDERDVARRKGYIASIAAATSALQFGEMARVRRHLAAAPAEHRGWEWGWLSHISDSSVYVADAGGRIIQPATSTGHRLLTLDREGSAVRWSLDRRSAEPPMRPFGGGVVAAAIVGDGERFAAAGAAGELAIVRCSDGSIERSWPALDAPAVAISATATGRIAAVTRGGEVVVFEPESNAPRVVPGVVRARDARFAADGSALVTWSDEAFVRVHDGTTLAVRHEWTYDGEIGAIEVRTDLDRVSIGRGSGLAHLRSISSGAEIVTLQMRDGLSLVRAIAHNADGSLVAIGQGNSSITVITTADSGLHYVGIGHGEAISGLAFVDGNTLASSSWDGTIRWWDITRQRDVTSRSVATDERTTMCVRFAPVGSVVASAASDGVVRLWDATTGGEIRGFSGHASTIVSVRWSGDGRSLASASQDGTVRVWDVDSGSERAVLRGHQGAVYAADISRDGAMVASGGEDRSVRLWDVAGGRQIALLEGHTSRVTDVAFSHDGTRLATTSRDGDVRLWRVADGAPLQTLRGHDWDVFAVVWSADDATIYSGSRDQTVRAWNASTGRSLAVFEGAGQFITSLSLASDGSRLAAATWFGSVVLFDPRSGELVASFLAAPLTLRSIDFSSDAARMATAASDGTMRIFESEETRQPRP
jgi:WD40 repeat protein